MLGYAPAVDLDEGLRATAAAYVAAGYLPPAPATTGRHSHAYGRRLYPMLAALAEFPLY
jgi:hypothetical protein